MHEPSTPDLARAIGLSIIASAADGERHLLAVTGAVDLATAPQLRQRLREELAAGHSVDLDVAEVDFIDSAGIRVLAEARAEFTDAGRDVRLMAPVPAQMRRIIQLTGLLDGLTVAGAD